jgi:hypothetical protein
MPEVTERVAEGSASEPARLAASPTAQLIAASWGFAEAIAWFIVPDVWAGWVTLLAPRRVLVTLGSVVVGALLGSLVLTWIAVLTGGIGTFLGSLPGITPADLAQASSELSGSGPIAMLGGVLQGLPLKVYVHQAALLNLSLPAVLAFAVLNRLERVGLSLVVTAVAGVALRGWIARHPWLTTGGYAVVWLAIYVAYFAARGF